MIRGLEELLKEAREELKAASTPDLVLQVKGKYVGRKGEIASLLKGLGTLPPEERKSAGEAINRVKTGIETEIDRLLEGFKSGEKEEKLKKERVDITLPGRRSPSGRLHPVTQVMDEIEDIFLGLGFDIAMGPEVELDYYNFEALNFPPDHPARDMQDTFFVAGDVLLRTHTSSVQPRVMEGRKPPL
ncbi:MAG: phenylalanine--tRNA ligase subunit alpha, partial [Deltaproteobacteria bacterium]|nr:phenylalanine--tRNA ligase subunit alpha [Deltaproteobacteria bacterium]